jgi:hypothetical protein
MMEFQIPELYGCVEAPTFFEQYFVFIFVLFFFIMGVIVVLCYQAFVRYKESRKPCWEVALDKIGQLNLPSGAKHADIKRFYADLTRILKWYCHKRYSFVFADKTDEELLELLRSFECDAVSLDKLSGVMAASVQVKFAEGLVPLSTVEADKFAIAEFIRLSKPVKA